MRCSEFLGYELAVLEESLRENRKKKNRKKGQEQTDVGAERGSRTGSWLDNRQDSQQSQLPLDTSQAEPLLMEPTLAVHRSTRSFRPKTHGTARDSGPIGRSGCNDGGRVMKTGPAANLSVYRPVVVKNWQPVSVF